LPIDSNVGVVIVVFEHVSVSQGRVSAIIVPLVHCIVIAIAFLGRWTPTKGMFVKAFQRSPHNVNEKYGFYKWKKWGGKSLVPGRF
jgi:hypothetical protein